LSDEFERLCMEMSNKIDELLNVHKKFGVSIESFESSLGEINKLNFTYLSIATSVREAFNQVFSGYLASLTFPHFIFILF